MVGSLLKRAAGTLGALALAVLAVAGPVAAQAPGGATVDPRLLQQLIRQAPALRPETVVQSPVDLSRGLAEGTKAPAPAAAPPEPPSPLEIDYSARAGVAVHQFGYGVFRPHGAAPVPTIGAIQDSYVLGIGDELVITFRGQVSQAMRTRVDREGRVVLPELPPIPAAGRTFGDFVRDLKAATRQAMLGTDVFVSLGAVRAVSVLVIGEVAHPGTRQITGLSTIIDALAAAGGIRKTGSLRRIQVVRGDTTFWLDGYDLLFSGDFGRDIRVVDGDRIVVPPIGETVAVVGKVKRPAIYELAEGRRRIALADLLDLAGGTLRPLGNRFLHVAPDAAGRDRVREETPSSGATFAGGDILMVGFGEDVRLGSATLDGDVRLRQRRSIAAAPTVRALVHDVTLLGEDPYLPFAVLITTDPETYAQRYVPVDLGRVLAGEADRPLRSGDRLIVLSGDDIRYLVSTDVVSVLAGHGLPAEAVAMAPGTAPNPAGSTVPFAGSPRTPAVGFAPPLPGAPPSPAGETPPASGAGPSPACAGLAALAASGLDQGRFAGALRQVTGDSLRRPCPEIFARFGDLLPVVLDYAVSITGEVRRPGLYPVLPGSSLADLVTIAGGLTRAADLASVEVTRYADGQQRHGRLDLHASGLGGVRLGPGDAVRINGLGTVVLDGNVRAVERLALATTPSLQRLLFDPGQLGANPYLPFGVVVTTDPVTLARRFVAVDLQRILAGRDDYTLRAGDRLIVLGMDDVRYLASADVQAILTGQPLPGRAPPGGSRAGAETVRAVRLAGAPEAVAGTAERPAVTVMQPACDGLRALAQIAASARAGRFASAVRAATTGTKVAVQNRLSCPPIFARFGALLPFLLDYVVSVNGEVRQPGAYPILPGTSLGAVVAVAGGLNREVDLTAVELTRFSGGATNKFRRGLIDLSSAGLVAVTLNPGDSVRFNARLSARDTGPVLLSGEFVRAGLYEIRRGERLSELIARAGGLTPDAYPFGAVFTREQAKAAERAALQRSASELEMALTAAITRRGNDAAISGDAAAALRGIAQEVRHTKPVGRVVIEADPAVLATHPEVDIVLDPGDRLFMPRRPNTVTVIG